MNARGKLPNRCPSILLALDAPFALFTATLMPVGRTVPAGPGFRREGNLSVVGHARRRLASRDPSAESPQICNSARRPPAYAREQLNLNVQTWAWPPAEVRVAFKQSETARRERTGGTRAKLVARPRRRTHR